MRPLPLPLTLTARLLPVVILAVTGWAWTSDPGASSAERTDASSGSGATPSASATAVAVQTYRTSPAPCDSMSDKTIKSLVPGAKTAGKELASTDKSVRRTCAWNALKGYDYRWLDVTFEIKDDDAAAQKAYKQRIAEKSGGGAVPGLGDTAYSVVNLTTEDKQETREGVVIVSASNALVVVTYNGSDFETKKAPSTDEINKGAIKAAKDAVAALEDGRQN
ncbi:hypothetical protein [Streptomyces jeddahensis]|uniref:DUF3558 domain-containing protein n=1 Tax=Streptomyces jeddahensis TaxID=1716141 RepID=A0A177HIX0_9ACTN|nr:hypothetical protein [Streptomyces jeddahensis]OAH10676.1 hypothetical protein STSP_59980 [Streptomyces jeddahensis]